MVIAIASQKGGVGKSTTSITLAAGLGRQGKKVLIIDMDAQANTSKVLIPGYARLHRDETIFRTICFNDQVDNGEDRSIPVHQTTIPNVSIAPSHILLSDADGIITTGKYIRELRLKNELIKIKDKYDYVFIDCPPTLSYLTVNAFTASDQTIIVCSPGYFELDSLIQIQKTLSDIKKYYNPDLKLLGILFTMSDPTVNSKTSLQVLRQTYTDLVFKSVIPRNTDIRDATFNKVDIYEFNPNSSSAHAYTNLIEEIFP